MEGSMVLNVVSLAAPGNVPPPQNVQLPGSIGEGSYHFVQMAGIDGNEPNEDVPVITTVECRICHLEDDIRKLEIPCGCRGSLKYTHRECVQRWCNAKGDIICEICRKQYEPGYVAPPPSFPDETVNEVRDGWTNTGNPLDLHDPPVLSASLTEQQLLEARYIKYMARNASISAFFHAAVMTILTLMLLGNASGLTNVEESGYANRLAVFCLEISFFSLFLYMIGFAIKIFRRRKERQIVAALTAARVDHLMEHVRQEPIATEPASPMTPQPEP